MKKILLFGFISLSLSLDSYSQADGLLIAENFPYSTGNLTGQGSPAWTSSGGGGDVVVTALSDNTGSLVYAGYSSGSSYITTSNGNTKDPYKGFIGSQTVSTANATTFYMSFVVRVAASSNTSSTFIASPSAALRTSSGGNLCYFYVADNGGFGTQYLKFGISKTGALGGGNYASGNYSFNTTYLIIIRYDIVTGGTTNDRMYLWVNPAVDNEPSTASADQTITTGSDGNPSGNVTALQLLEDNFFDGTTASFDAFKIAYATGYTGSPSNPSVAWSDLDPVGAPLPVKLGNLKASQQAQAIRLDWSSYSEENVDHYEIEHSSDGKSFVEIGQLPANGNNAGRVDYYWLDEPSAGGTNFYRIKSIDIDGKITYSSVVKISLDNSGKARMSLYPNPVKGPEIALQFTNLPKGNYSVQIFNNAGQQLSQLQIYLANENTTQTMQLPSGIKPGTYSLRVTKDAVRFNQIFIVK